MRGIEVVGWDNMQATTCQVRQGKLRFGATLQVYLWGFGERADACFLHCGQGASLLMTLCLEMWEIGP
jgi:hypothetical protein